MRFIYDRLIGGPMIEFRWISVSGILFLLYSNPLLSGEVFKLGGDIRSNLYLGLVYGDVYNYFNSNVVTLKGDVKPDENVSGYFELRMRNENIREIKSMDDLKLRESIEPVSFQFYEGYIQFNSLFIKPLDFKVGKQRIAWGTADGFNPTDNFSPYDFEDPLDFKNKLSVWALNSTLYLSHFDLSIVLQPLFEPSLLPNFDILGSQNSPLMAEYQDRLKAPEVRIPEQRAKNFIFGSRLKYKGEILDVSLSYYHGYMNIPALSELRIETGGFALRSVTPVLTYPGQDVLGVDFALNLFDIGFFGEGAVVFPEEVRPSYFINNNKIDENAKKTFGIKGDLTSIEGDPFVKFVLGMDYTFRGGYYFNLQYVRGFFNELSSSALNNYIFVYMKKELFDSRLEIQPSVGFELDSDNDEVFGNKKTNDEKAYIFSFEANYTPFNTGKITLGAALARGEEGSNLKMFEKLDQIYLKFRLDF